jgi:hypothetical protein
MLRDHGRPLAAHDRDDVVVLIALAVFAQWTGWPANRKMPSSSSIFFQSVEMKAQCCSPLLKSADPAPFLFLSSDNAAQSV